MNRTYRLIWNQAASAWVVAPETAKAARKGGKLKAAAVAVAAVASVVAVNAYALPTGGQVSAGSGTISQSGSTMTVNQGSQNLSVNWNSFNVGSSETVTFVQPNSSAIALNRVLGSDPSAIYGKLNANGQVFLVNPNGILFAKGSQVNVGGLVASTQNISDADFLNRNFHFSGTAGSVVNQGTINGNYVALLGGQVSNQGTIAAKLGTVALAAGSDITLDFAGDGLIGVTVNQGTLNALAENKQLIQADGGTVVLTAKAADSLISAVVNNSGEIDAKSVQNVGGTIKLVGDTTAGIAENSGTLNGNEVDVNARSVLQSGAVNANAANLSATYALIQTDGASVTGNSVRVDGGEHTFISGALTGTHDLTVAGQSITLAGANLNTGNNGSIRVGGGEHGQDADIVNAQRVSVNGATTITGGDGAHVTLWSDGTTNYFGNIATGNNSFVEVSSKNTLNLVGKVTVGAGSQILGDPTNMVIDASPTSSMFYLDLADPSPAAGNYHGSGGVTALANGNIVVSSPQDSFGASGAGAVYLYNGKTGALISTLTGSNAGDNVGNYGVTALAGGNYVVDSANWNSGKGAVTWGSGTSGVAGTVGSSNSLVGSNAGDSVGSSGITALANGNYVVDSAYWSSGKGAVTWGSGTSGVTGTVGSSNSLVGSNMGDNVGGSGITALANGNYVVDSSNWNGNTGAVTWGSGTSGVTGTVGSSNSLVGSSAGDSGDSVGIGGVTALANGNYVVDSSNWNGNTGAVTWGSGTSGIAGVVGSSNSLVGSSVGDSVGNGYYGNNGVTALANGNYVVRSSGWNSNKGAVTWGSGTSGVTGTVGSSNSLVGSNANDQVGSGGITALANGNYVVDSSYWNSSKGAVTWGSGTSGITGTVGSSNSLVGSSAGDSVGSDGITALANGNYVVDSSGWNSGRGAVTWGSGTSGVIGTVGSSNSLVGSNANDQVGYGYNGNNIGITALANGNYVVDSANWSSSKGAVTWGSGTSGVTGTVGSSNSLVGSNAFDLVGSNGITALAGGNYVVDSANWSSSKGAVTWGSGTSGVTGVVSSANSLVGGNANDYVGGGDGGRVTALANGNYVVDSPVWNGYKGAVTWGSGTSGVTGTVGSSNSLVGSNANDQVGSNGITALANGNYVVDSPNWNSNKGAVWLVADPSNLGSLASGSAADVTVSPAQLAVADGAGSSVTLQATNNITVNSVVSVAGKLDLVAGNTVTLNAGLTSTAGGDALVLAGTNFVNNAGASALSTPNGRWLVYSAGPTNNSAGGLSDGGADVYASTFAANAPSTIASGNHFVYAGQPASTGTPASPSTPTSPSTAPTATTAPAGGSAPGYTGTLAWMQTLNSGTSPGFGSTPGMGVSGTAGNPADDTFASGGDAPRGESSGNNNGNGNGRSLATTGGVNTDANIPSLAIPGVTLIDSGIRLPDGLNRNF